MIKELYTIGHSIHSSEKLIELLKVHAIAAICDVRSQPYSAYAPQFNKESFQKQLKKNNIAFVFLGRELGARSEIPSCYINGKVQFHLLMNTIQFKEGISRLIRGIKTYRFLL